MIRTNQSKAATKRGVRIKSRVKAGFHFTAVVSKPSPIGNHNQTAKGLRVKSRVKAGKVAFQDIHFT